MSGDVLFGYATDCETMAACFGIVMRSAARVRAGQSAVLGAVKARGKMQHRHEKRIHWRASPELRAEIVARWHCGETAVGIAKALKCQQRIVDRLTAGVPRAKQRRQFFE